MYDSREVGALISNYRFRDGVPVKLAFFKFALKMQLQLSFIIISEMKQKNFLLHLVAHLVFLLH